MHRFYEEQFQLNGGQQNRYMLQSDAAGLVMGVYDTKALPIYQSGKAPLRRGDGGDERGKGGEVDGRLRMAGP